MQTPDKPAQDPAPNTTEALAAIAREALDEWEYAAQYKGEFLAKKHGDAERIAEHRKALGALLVRASAA